MKTTVYTANPKTHFFKELRDIFKDIKSSNFLSKQMAKRDIQAQYRQSLLGVFWALSPVITTSVIWIFINQSGAVKLPETDIPKPLFIVIGTTLWSIFTESVNIPTTSINSSRSIISKINFPKEALLISGMYKMLFNTGIKLILVLVLLLVYGISPDSNIWLFPIYLIALMILGSSIGVFLAPIGLLYSDVGRSIQLIFTFLMYATPVIYPVPKGGIFATVFEYNPLTPLIISARNILTGHELYQVDSLFYVLLFSSLLLMVSLVIFRNSMNILIEKIGA